MKLDWIELSLYYLRYFIWFNAAVTLLLINLPLFDSSSLLTLAPVGSLDGARWELPDGLWISVNTKPFSDDGDAVVLSFDGETLTKELTFGGRLLVDVHEIVEGVGEEGGDRSCLGDVDLNRAGSGRINGSVGLICTLSVGTK